MGIADPVTTPDTGNHWLDSIMWGTQWSSGAAAGEPTAIYYYLAGIAGGEEVALDGGTVLASSPLYNEEIMSMVSAMDAMASVANIQFYSVAEQSSADIIWASVNDADARGALGWANPPGTEYNSNIDDYQSLIAINYEAYNPNFPDPDLLAPGGFDYITYIHELGHALGLAHPHDNGGGSEIAPGVGAPFGDYGDFDLNQGVYSMMSYNDGWQTDAIEPGAAYGYEMGPMAFDIAALQIMYGANMNYRKGNDIYGLPTANEVGTGYMCLWDAGGTDKIIGGDFGNVIDLRAATLRTEAGGGGWISYATGISGGFTIANGVVIENAVGGEGKDILVGNDASNRLVGMEGSDELRGGAGVDTMVGGEGDDKYYVDRMADKVTEAVGQGSDTVYASVNYMLLSGVEAEFLIANAGNASIALTGNSYANKIYSGNGNDTLAGGLGDDIFYVNNAGDKVNEAVGGGSDTVFAKTNYVLLANQEIEFLRANTGATPVTLKGNNLANTIQGSTGGDQLYGGGANDTFLYRSVAESTGAGFDKIFDFNTGDKLDFRNIDADSNGANGDSAFVLDAVGNNSFGIGHIRQTVVGSTLKLEFNTDADATAEMTILLQNHGFGLQSTEIYG